MTDVNIVCNCNGKKLDELEIAVQRQYKITSGFNSATGGFEISARDNKATARNLRYGNIIYVTSSVVGLRDYAAVIWPTDNGTGVEDGILKFNLRSYEWILSTRYTDVQETFEGTPGQIAIMLLTSARRNGNFPVTLDTNLVNIGGEHTTKVYNFANIYKALNDLAQDYGFLWYLQPNVDAVTNNLSLQLVWDYQKTRTFPIRLSTGGDRPYLQVDKIKERGEIANRVIAFGKFADWAQPNVSEPQISQKSQSFYGQVYEVVIENNIDISPAGLDNLAAAYLQEHAFPKISIDGAILREPYPRFGDILTVEMPANNSFIIDRRGSDIKMQLTNAIYTPDDKSYAVHLEEIIDNA